jgi:hypothetical protein
VTSFGPAGVVPPVPALPVVPAAPVVPPRPALPVVPAAPDVEPPVPGPPPVPALPVVPALPLVPAVPVLSMQALLVQVWFEAQQAVPQAVPVEQLELQVPPLQTSFPVHAFVQVPQWVASDATQEPLHSSSPEGHLHWLAWQVWPPRQGMPQPPQLSGSDVVFRHCEPQAVSPEGQLTVPPVPVAPLPAVPGLPPVEGLEQAAAKITKQSPRRERPVFIVIRIPGETRPDLPRREFNAIAPVAKRTNLVHE